MASIGTLSSSSEDSDKVRKLAGEGMYSEFFVLSSTNSSMAKSVVPSLSNLACNCVDPSLSVSSLSTVLTGALSLSLACLGFLNGFLTVFMGGLERAEQALALDCHGPFCISNSTTNTENKERETTRQG